MTNKAASNFKNKLVRDHFFVTCACSVTILYKIMGTNKLNFSLINYQKFAWYFLFQKSEAFMQWAHSGKCAIHCFNLLAMPRIGCGPPTHQSSSIWCGWNAAYLHENCNAEMHFPNHIWQCRKINFSTVLLLRRLNNFITSFFTVCFDEITDTDRFTL
jgi:hypothetical protein